MTRLRLGTRGSQLALWQARMVADLIGKRGGPACDIVVVRTSGDRLAEASLAEIGGKRLFVKEIEDALLEGRIDLGVHSAKDMSATLPDGLALAAALPREDPWDALVLRAGVPTPVPADLPHVVTGLGPAPLIGTSSVRRAAQLTRLMPGARFAPVRGNLDTRLRKLDAGEHDALVLAAAGLRRLDLAHRASALLPLSACVPAPGQGIIVIEIRSGDQHVEEVASALNDAAASAALAAEQAVVVALGGGCQMPLGAVALPVAGELELHAVVVSPDGARAVRRHGSGPSTEPEALGRRIAEDLLHEGADLILEDLRRATTPVEGSP